MKASPFYLNLIGVKVYVGNTTSTMVILNCVCCIFYHVNTDHRGQLLLTSCIHFMTHLFLDESSLSPWQILRLTSYECSPRFFEEYDTNNVRSCKQNLPKKKKTTVKNGGPRVQYEVIVVICNVFASCRFEKFKIKGAWQTNHPVLLTQPSSLSGFSKYFVHNLFICHFSMNYADSENFRTNRGFSWHSLYMYKYFIDTLFLNLF